MASASRALSNSMALPRMVSDRSFFVLNISGLLVGVSRIAMSLCRCCSAGQARQARVQSFNCLVTVGNVVKLDEEVERVVREPGFSRFVFPDQDSQQQVQSDGLLALHQRCACLGVAEDQDLRWAQAQSDLLSFGGVVNVREEMNSLLGK